MIWKKGDVILSNTTYTTTSSLYNVTTTFSIAKLNYTDRALYSCILTNEVGNHTEVVDVRVISKSYQLHRFKMCRYN